MTTIEKWYEINGCTHARCPRGCEQPYAIFDQRGELICGRCWIKHGVRSRMLPCAD